MEMFAKHGHGAPSVMAELFGKIPSDASAFFTVSRLDMQGRKVEVSSPAIYSPIHCFFFLAGGEAMIGIGQEMYFFRAGECATIPAGQIFSVRYFDNCTGYMGGFNNEFISDGGINPLQTYGALRRWGSHKVFFESPAADHMAGIFERLHAEHHGGRNPKIVKAYLAVLFTEIEEASGKNSAPAAMVTENALCNRFLEDIFQSPRFDKSPADYAAGMNVSPDYFQKLVKRITGKSPLAWIHEAVILDAKSLLFSMDMSVGEIAARVGVEDPAYFSRLFKRHTGLTPVQYRSAKKKSNTNPG